MTKQKIVVAGGAGFIGSHFVDALLRQDNQLLVIDDLSQGKSQNLPANIEFFKGDLREQKTLDTIKKFKPEAIFHFAAQIDVQKSIKNPIEDAGQNIIMSLKLMQCGLECGIRYFAFASSGGAIYGESINGPQDEHHPEQPINPYGVAKLSVDKYLFAFSHQYDLDYASMRFSNVYGPRQNPKGEAGVVAVFAEKIISNQPIRINGSGLQTRDFIYVKDLAEAGLALLENKHTGIFNLGTARATQILDLARQMISIAGTSTAIHHGPELPGEQKSSVLNPAKAMQIAGWSPKTPLSEGLKETLSWYAENYK